MWNYVAFRRMAMCGITLKKGEMGGDYSDPSAKPVVLVWDPSRIGQNRTLLRQGPRAAGEVGGC